MKKIIEEIKESILKTKVKDIFRYNEYNNTETYHSNYYLIFILEFILFGCFSLYLYKSSRYFLNKIESNAFFVPRGIVEKHELLLHLSRATFFRFLSLIYIIVFANKTALDFVSFINRIIMHILPSFLFLMSFYIYIGFLIKKYYELSFRRMYIVTSLRFILYFSFLLIILLSLAALLFNLYKESYFFVETLMCINYLIIGFLYLIYGRKITVFMKEYSNNKREINPLVMKRIRKMINSRIIPTCFIISVSYIFLGVVEGLVAIDFFGIYYPNFMDLNLFDSIVFFFCELLPSFIIGYSKKNWNHFRIEEIINTYGMKDYINRFKLRQMEEIEIFDGNKELEEKMKTLLEKFEAEKNI